MASLAPVVFFDIGNTLAAARMVAPTSRLEFRVFPDVPPVLDALRQEGVRLGILSDPGPIPASAVNEALAQAGLLIFFERNLILYGPKNSPWLFEQAAALVRPPGGGTPPRVLFVGEDATERGFARQAGLFVVPHPSLAREMLAQAAPLRYLRIRVPPAQAQTDWRAALRGHHLLPLHLTATAGEAPSVYAVASATTAAKLDDLGFWVDRLGAADEPLASDLYLLRDDRQEQSGFLAPEGNSSAFFSDPQAARLILTSTHEGLFVSVPAGRSVESYHFPGAQHGHNLKLTPSQTLLEATEPADNNRLAETVNAAFSLFAPEAAALAPSLTPAESATLTDHITAALVQQDVARYTGAQPLDTATSILSRHVHHPGNGLAVNALVNDLTGLGAGRLTVNTHRFTHEGSPCDNVEAVLPASGLNGIVLVTAHLDSTGARQDGYRAALDAAPGADDDASGVAGVLSSARALLALAAQSPTTLRREVRLVLFNAEEHGLVGSRAYAREQAALGAQIVAVFQLDMIGYDVTPARTFELHAGFTTVPAVQSRSLRLAGLVQSMVPLVSPALPPPQIYPASQFGSDPAERRSDHYSFQVEGYAACLASEDFFAGPGLGAPAPEPNPNYHLPADNTANAGYTADIARAVAAAAWFAATR